MNTHALTRRAGAVALVGCIGFTTASCSFAFVSGPPKGHERMTYFRCTDSYRLPGGDVIMGLMTIVGPGVAYLASAWVGFDRVQKCNEAKEASDRAFLQFLATPEGLRADASIDVVLVSSEASSPIDTLRAGASMQLRAAATNKAGAEISNRQFRWTSSDTLLAAVSATGAVTGRAPGAARISATTGGITGTREVVVVP